MGGGTSNLTGAQMGTISKVMRDRYEELKASGTSDVEMLRILTEEFNNSVTDKPVPLVDASKKIGISATNVQKKLAAGSSKMATGSTKSTRTVSTKAGTQSRRKSFDVKKTPAGDQNSLIPTPAISQTPSAEALETKPETDAVDSWDSVTQQPFCKICQMGFKSMPFLERHVKYSDVHQKNVKAAENPKPEGATEPNEFTLPISGFTASTPSTKMGPKQIEGEHYKLLYTGSKFFWRTSETVDFDIYHHILPHAIEVISYDLVKGREMNRLYLDMTLLTAVLKKGGVDVKEEDSLRSGITTYLLQRLQLRSGVPKDTGVNSMSWVPLSGDSTTLKSPLLDKAPVVLIPVPVVRRRRTNAEEIEATISSLASDREALVAATGMAERIANLVYASASSIAAKKWWSDFNPVRRRWIWAIRRVIRQKLVAETRQVLTARALAKEGKSPARSPRKNLSRKNTSSEM